MNPNTFILGAPKCGTTALAQYLSEHPNVFFSKPKEPFFWSDDIKQTPHELRPSDLDDYLSLFADADPAQHKVVAEGSTRYLRSMRAVPRILDFNPDAKFIAMLRNPTEVAQAFHMEQLYVLHEDDPDFASAWAKQDARERGEMMPASAVGGDYVLYRRVASFADQVQRLYDWVPNPDQRKIILMDDFKADAGAVYRDTLAFLDLPDDGWTEFAPVNSAHAQRFPGLAKLLLYPPEPLQDPLRRLRRFLLNNKVPGIATLKGFLNVERKRNAVPEEVLDEVRAAFAPDVARLGELLGRDLSHWSQR